MQLRFFAVLVEYTRFSLRYSPSGVETVDKRWLEVYSNYVKFSVLYRREEPLC